jgi:hypothetical protein
MNTSHIIEHLKIARDLAKVDGNAFVAYLIDMAISAIETSGASNAEAERAA